MASSSVLRIEFSTYIASFVTFHLEESVMREDIEQQELKNEVENKEPVSESLFKEPAPPLFVSDSSEGKKGNPQDEKDETEE